MFANATLPSPLWQIANCVQCRLLALNVSTQLFSSVRLTPFATHAEILILTVSRARLISFVTHATQVTQLKYLEQLSFASAAPQFRTAYFAQAQPSVLHAAQVTLQYLVCVPNAEHSFSIVRPVLMLRRALCASLVTIWMHLTFVNVTLAIALWRIAYCVLCRLLALNVSTQLFS